MSAKTVVLEIDLSLGVLSHVPQDPLTAVRSRNTPRLSQIIAGLRQAAEDEKVAAVIIHVTGGIQVAQAEELAVALWDFSAAGKQVVAWAESFGELGPGTIAYYLATTADQIWMQPSGSVGLQGVGLEVSTVRGVLDKISAEPQIGQRHEYKTVGEMYTSTEVTAPNREMTGRIAASVTEQVTAATVSSRSLTADAVTEAITAAPVPAEAAVRHGLVDKLGYRTDVYESVRADLGETRLLFAHRYSPPLPTQLLERAQQRNRPVVAVVPIEGAIVTGRGRPSPLGRQQQAGSDTVTAALRAAADDEDVRAVVLRVDSPGGSYVGSDAIRDEVLRIRRSGRPVIASMGALAASGGYFVSMPADRIVALPSTLTGSIGVLGGKVVIKDTLARIGIAREAIGTDEATMFSANRRFDEAEWAKIESWLDAVYDDFTQKAATDRGLEYSQLEAHARGRVWTGADAKDRGLVDELGGLRAAIELACREVGADPDRVRVQQFPQLGMLARLKPAESTESPAAAAISARPAGLLQSVARELGVGDTGVLTLPWRFELS